jgi:hypothetical protein
MSARTAIGMRAALSILVLLQVVIVIVKLFYLNSGPGSVAFGFLMLLITSGAAWVTFATTSRWLR